MKKNIFILISILAVLIFIFMSWLNNLKESPVEQKIQSNVPIVELKNDEVFNKNLIEENKSEASQEQGYLAI